MKAGIRIPMQYSEILCTHKKLLVSKNKLFFVSETLYGQNYRNYGKILIRIIKNFKFENKILIDKLLDSRIVAVGSLQNEPVVVSLHKNMLIINKVFEKNYIKTINREEEIFLDSSSRVFLFKEHLYAMIGSGKIYIYKEESNKFNFLIEYCNINGIQISRSVYIFSPNKLYYLDDNLKVKKEFTVKNGIGVFSSSNSQIYILDQKNRILIFSKETGKEIYTDFFEDLDLNCNILFYNNSLLFISKFTKNYIVKYEFAEKMNFVRAYDVLGNDILAVEDHIVGFDIQKYCCILFTEKAYYIFHFH